MRVRSLSARQLLLLGWELVIEQAAPWQVELLLAECAGFVSDHDAAVARLDRLIKSSALPKEQFGSVRRALFRARRRQRGLPVD